MKVIVASQNPVKINATLVGFQKVFKNTKIFIEGQNVWSGVSDQPIGNQETYLGAYNRAFNAKNEYPNADYWVGLEGGNIVYADEMEAMAWIVIIDKNNKIGKARTAGFYLPQKIIQLIREGLELGDADAQVFGIENSKQKMGSTGLLTNGVLDRTEFYIQAVVLALIPFIQKDLY